MLHRTPYATEAVQFSQRPTRILGKTAIALSSGGFIFQSEHFGDMVLALAIFLLRNAVVLRGESLPDRATLSDRELEIWWCAFLRLDVKSTFHKDRWYLLFFVANRSRETHEWFEKEWHPSFWRKSCLCGLRGGRPAKRPRLDEFRVGGEEHPFKYVSKLIVCPVVGTHSGSGGSRGGGRNVGGRGARGSSGGGGASQARPRPTLVA